MSIRAAVVVVIFTLEIAASAGYDEASVGVLWFDRLVDAKAEKQMLTHRT